MPETITVSLNANELREGDLVKHPGDFYVVDNVDAKVKWVYVNGHRPDAQIPTLLRKRYELYWTMQVDRQVESAAERVEREAAERDERYAWTLEQLLRSATRAFADQREAADAVAERVSSGYRISYSELDNLAVAAVNVDFWAHVLRYVGGEFDEEDGPLCGRRVDLGLAYVIVLNQARNDLLENRYRGQSTSSMSNLLNEVGRDVLSKLVQRRWGMGFEKEVREHWSDFELNEYDSGALSIW
jgi:hypothetical protein